MSFLKNFLNNIHSVLSNYKSGITIIVSVAIIFTGLFTLLYLNAETITQYAGFSGYSRGYFLKNRQVYLKSLVGSTEKLIAEADYKSFKVLRVIGFAKDKNNIYLAGKKLNVDPTTFAFAREIDKAELLKGWIYGEKYFKDKNSVFYYFYDYRDYENDRNSYQADLHEYQTQKLENADPASFKLLGDDYAQDNQQVYYQNQILPGLDGSSFAFLKNNQGEAVYRYAKDKNNVYFLAFSYADGKKVPEFKIIENADAATFNFLSEGAEGELAKILEMDDYYNLAYDKNNLYLENNKLADLKSLVAYEECNYLKYENAVYMRVFNTGDAWQKIITADAPSFKQLDEHCYMADRNNLYYTTVFGHGDVNLVTQPGVDFETFEAVGVLQDYNNWTSYHYAKDKNAYYFYGKKIEGSDVASFKITNENLANDNYSYYYSGAAIEGSDVASFERINDFLFKDKNNVYYYGSILAGADAATFTVKKNNGGRYWTYYQDKDSIFLDLGEQRRLFVRFDNEQVEDIQILNDGFTFAKGKNKVYHLAYGQPAAVVINNADYDSFEVIERGPVAKDKNHVFYYNIIVTEADSASFTDVSEVYNQYRDKNAIYINSDYSCSDHKRKLLRFANEDFFNFKEIIDNSCYYKGKKTIYYEDTSITEADYDSFEGIKYKYEYAKDKNYVYKEGKIIPNTNPETFKFE